MTTSAPKWLVLLKQAPLQDRAGARDCLSAVLGVNKIDAMVKARQAYGILAEDIGEGQAQELASALGNFGIEAEAVTVAELPDPIPGAVVHNADAIERGLVIQGLYGKEQGTVPWDRVSVVSVGSIHQERRAEHTHGDAFMPVGRDTGGQVRPSIPHLRYTQPPPELRVHVLTAEPIYELRFTEHKMNYDYLGARLQPNAAANFRLFVLDLVELSQRARVTDSVRSFLERQRPPRHEFRDEDAFTRYNRWHLCLAMLGR